MCNQRRERDNLPREILTLFTGCLFGKDIVSFRLSNQRRAWDNLPREILTFFKGCLFGQDIASFRLKSNQRRRAWDNLPSEILTLIKGRLFGKDIASFRLVCTHWSLAPASLDKQISYPISEIVKYPLLLRFRRRKNQLEDSSSSSSSSYCEVYSPAFNKTYALNLGSGSGCFGDARIQCCNFGWLLLSQDTRFFFLHPTSGHVIYLTASLPTQPKCCYNRMSFSAPPTSPDCLVFGLMDVSCSHVYIGFTRRGDTSWTTHYLHEGGFLSKMKLKFNNNKKKKKNICKLRPTPCILQGHFDSSNSSSAPVFHNGAFYSLGSNGRLGVFDPRRKKKNMWRLLDTVHDAFSFDDDADYPPDLCETYLMELSNSSLISVVVGSSGEDVRVVKFNDRLKKWQRVSCLDDRVVFLSRPSSIVMRCEELGVKGLENTIHFPRFHRGGSKCYNVFYSLHSGKFHSFEGGYVSEDLRDTKLPLNCTWILPEFQRFNDQQLNWSLIKPPRSIGDDLTRDPFYFIQHLTFLPPNYSFFKKKSHWGRKVVEEEEEVSVMQKPWIIILQESKGFVQNPNIVAVDLCTGISHSYEDNIIGARLRGMNVFGCRTGRVLFKDKFGVCSLLDTSSMTIDPLPTWEICSLQRST
ncbi:F-box/kelch-repeat protein At1g57790 [Linum grandiflorum]